MGKNSSSKKLTKEDFINDFLNTNKKYQMKFPGKIMPRRFYTKNSIYNWSFNQYMTYTELKDQAIGNILKNKEDDYFNESIDEKNARVIEAQIAGIKTIEELITYANIDMTKWKITKQVVNRWGNFENSNYQIKVWLAPLEDTKEEKQLKYWLNLFKEKSLNYKPKNIEKEKRIYNSSNKIPVLLELALVDHHLGQLSWSEETGYGNYDIKIAKNFFIDAVHYLVEAASQYNIEQILFIIGNDFFNVNSQLKTTVKGTVQDEDCRWQKSFNYGIDLLVEVIDYLESFAPVHVKQIPGNHDQERIYYAGAYLDAWYRNDSNIVIDNEPKVRKYYQYGKNLLGFAHGDVVKKMDRLIALMPLEAKEYWAITSNREWHCGHVHHESKKILILDTEETGVKIRTLSSLVVPDAWHAMHGFISNRQSQGFIWHKDKGNIAEFKYKP